MSEIANIANVFSPSVVPSSRTVRPVETLPTRRDTAEFSRMGETLARAMMESTLRIARTRAIQAEITNGTFETPARLNGTVDRLLDVIG